MADIVDALAVLSRSRDWAMSVADNIGRSNMMEQDFLAASVASIFACAVTTTGILVIHRYREWTQRNTIYFICFAAGVLISVSFLHIVPTAFAMNVEAPTYLLAGYLAMLGFDRFLTAYVCDRPMTSDYALGLLPNGRHRFPFLSRWCDLRDQLQRRHAYRGSCCAWNGPP